MLLNHHFTTGLWHPNQSRRHTREVSRGRQDFGRDVARWGPIPKWV